MRRRLDNISANAPSVPLFQGGAAQVKSEIKRFLEKNLTSSIDIDAS
jgi:hypothetical protein